MKRKKTLYIYLVSLSKKIKKAAACACARTFFCLLGHPSLYFSMEPSLSTNASPQTPQTPQLLSSNLANAAADSIGDNVFFDSFDGGGSASAAQPPPMIVYQYPVTFATAPGGIVSKSNMPQNAQQHHTNAKPLLDAVLKVLTGCAVIYLVFRIVFRCYAYFKQMHEATQSSIRQMNARNEKMYLDILEKTEALKKIYEQNASSSASAADNVASAALAQDNAVESDVAKESENAEEEEDEKKTTADQK